MRIALRTAMVKEDEDEEEVSCTQQSPSYNTSDIINESNRTRARLEVEDVGPDIEEPPSW